MTIATHPRTCAICGDGCKKLLYRQRFEAMSGSSLLLGYDVVACDGCGFCFADGIPDQAAFDQYYRDMSKYEHGDRAGQESAYDRSRFERVAAVVHDFLPAVDARILEIGCAAGGLLNTLRQLGCTQVEGVDPSPACAEAARRHYGLKVAAATLNSIDPKAGPWDFLILGGVMEHVRDLDAAVRKLAALLHQGGRVFLVVPDASRYAEGSDAPFQEFSVEHINFFGPASLANLMGHYGFREIGHRRGFIDVSRCTKTPVLYAAFELDATTRKPHMDEETALGMAEYIRQSAEQDRRIQDMIENVVREGRPILVWGTGAHTLRLLATSRLGEAKILAFIDANPKYQGQSLRSAPIISPAEVHRYAASILISSRVYQEEIAAKIRDELKLANPVLTLYEL